MTAASRSNALRPNRPLNCPENRIFLSYLPRAHFNAFWGICKGGRKPKKLGIPSGPLLGKLQDNEAVSFNGKKVSPKEVTYVEKGRKIRSSR